MKQILTVFRFTFREAVKKKAFIISTMIILAIILIMCFIPRIMESLKGDNKSDEVTKTCYFIDKDQLIPGAKETLALMYTDTEFVDGDLSQADSYREKIEKDADFSMITITGVDGVPNIQLTVKNFLSSITPDDVADVLSPIFAKSVMKDQGVSDEMIAVSQSLLPTTAEMVGSMDFSGYLLGILLLMLMFFAIYYYGYGVSMSVANEKASRVMETLIVSAKPSHVLIGKCLAMGALGLAQMSSFLLVGAIGYQLLVPKDFLIGGMPLSLSAFTLSSGILVLIYFIFGYSLYALMNAVCGAVVDKIEDLNSAMMPVMFISMASFYVGYFTALTDVGGLMTKIAIYVPFCSPFVVPFKLLNGDISGLDLAISIALLIVAIIVVGWISIRLYTASVLHYGKRMKLKELYKIKN